MSEEVIDIERFDNTVIQVEEETPSVSLDETALSEETTKEAPSVFNFTRRIIIGSILLILLVIPVGFGMYMSYQLDYYLKDAVNPEIIWPDSAYSGLKKTTIPLSSDYSFDTNNFYPIKDEDGKKMVVEFYSERFYPPKKYYAAAYLIENITGDKDLYGLCIVVQNEGQDKLRPTSFRPIIYNSTLYLERHSRASVNNLNEIVVHANTMGHTGILFQQPGFWEAPNLNTMKNYIKRDLKNFKLEGIQIFALPYSIDTRPSEFGYVKTLHEERRRSLDQAVLLVQNQSKDHEVSVFSGIPQLKTV